MLQTEFAPTRVAGLARGPPPDLQIHHRVNDGVVAADAPRCDQPGRRVVELLQALCRAQSAFTILRVFRLTIGEDRRVVVEKTCVVVLDRLFAEQARVPQFGPASEAFVLCLRVEQPQFADPEIARPEKSLLLLPLARTVVALRKEAEALVFRGLRGRRLRDDRLPLRSRALCGLLNEFERFRERLAARGAERVRWSRLRGRRLREERDARGPRQSAGRVAHESEKVVERLDRVGREDERAVAILLRRAVRAHPHVLAALLIPRGEHVPACRAVFKSGPHKKVERVVGDRCARRAGRDDCESEVLVLQHPCRGRGRARLLDLMSPRRAPQHRLVRRRGEDLILQAFLAHEARHKRQAVRALCVDAMLEAALTGPLCHAAREIDLAPADLPALVLQLDDDAHGPFRDDAPLAFGHVRDLLDASANERGDRACAERVADAEDVAP